MLAHFMEQSLTDLTDINRHSLRAWEQQWLPAMPAGKEWSDWDWSRGMARWRKCADRFEVAVWSGNQLCGLAVGKPSAGRGNLSLHAIQGSPIENHPLKGKILPIVIDTAGAYGTALQCKEYAL